MLCSYLSINPRKHAGDHLYDFGFIELVIYRSLHPLLSLLGDYNWLILTLMRCQPHLL